MKKKALISISLSVIILIVSVFTLSSCLLSKPLSVVGSRINDMGEVIISYSDGSEVNIGVVGGGNSTSYTINTADGGIAHAASRGISSTVSVTASFKSGASRGSGVIYKLDKSSGEAFIITNYHVVYNESTKTISSDINVFVYGSETDECKIPASFVGGSVYYDIAVLHVTSSELMKRASVDTVAVCPKRDVSVGETAIAVGNPEGAGISATLGVVSVDSEHIVMSALNGTGAVASRVIRVDTAINSGNSGGGLYNASGELIGIVNAKIADSSVENIGYAIPASIAIPVAENVIYNCYGKENKSLLRPMIGVTLESRYPGSVIDESTGLITKTESVVIGDVSSGSLAEGRLAVGDVITSVKIGSVSASITRLHHVIDMMLNARLGDTVEITLLRAGVSQTVSIVITNAALTEY